MDHVPTLVAAEQYAAYGYTPVPLVGKRPRLRDWQRPLERRELRYWLARHRLNVGILLSGTGLAVVDCDSIEGRRWADARGLVSPMVCETARGEHRYFRLAADRSGRTFPGGDLKTRGVTVAPPSEHPETGLPYRWRGGVVRPEQLPLLPRTILDRPAGPTPAPSTSGTIASVRRYIRKAVAVSGSGGHNTTFRVACRLAAAGLTEEQVLSELIAWQEDGCAVPKWTAAELAHKARDAVARTRDRR